MSNLAAIISAQTSGSGNRFATHPLFSPNRYLPNSVSPDEFVHAAVCKVQTPEVLRPSSESFSCVEVNIINSYNFDLYSVNVSVFLKVEASSEPALRDQCGCFLPFGLLLRSRGMNCTQSFSRELGDLGEISGINHLLLTNPGSSYGPSSSFDVIRCIVCVDSSKRQEPYVRKYGPHRRNVRRAAG